MQPTHFRAYAKDEAISRRNTAEGRQTLAHDVHNPAAEGELKSGIAAFSSKAPIDYVAFYAGEGDGEVCVGRLDGPFDAGKVSANFADIPQEPAPAPVDSEVVVGDAYRKVS